MGEAQASIIPLKRAVAGTAATGFDAREKVQSTHTSELVIALCGPIGSPLHQVADSIKVLLTDDFGYDKCEVIRLSDLIQEYAKESVQNVPAFERVTKLIDLGNKLRSEYGAGILAELAIARIAEDREELRQRTGTERYEPRRVCHIIDSIKNQEELDILKLVYRDMLYSIGVFSPISEREHVLGDKGMSQAQIYNLIDRDSGEELDHGQTVRDTFPLSDFFLRIAPDTDTQVNRKVERYLHLILGTKVITPWAAETAMYMAASAAGNSACLSRQVGAALTDEHGEIISVGWNDVPKAGGSLYVADPVNDPIGERDKRCWNIQGGTCFNDLEKRLTAEQLVAALIEDKLVAETERAKAVELVISKKSKVKHLIEFSRSIHAEMHAILLGSQSAGERVKKGKIYCTTYPCHSCARHIVAAGIKEVYYIEPYRKSLATKLHHDAISERESDEEKVRILPYDGVAPSRYLKLFKMLPEARKKDGKLPRANLKTAQPRFDKTMEALPVLEGVVIKSLVSKKLIEVSPAAASEVTKDEN